MKSIINDYQDKGIFPLPEDIIQCERINISHWKERRITILFQEATKANEQRKEKYNYFKAAAEFIQRLRVTDFLGCYHLVHGNLSSLDQNVTVNHAWLEELDFVYEVSVGHKRLFLKEDFYIKDSITNVRRYTVHQALKLIMLHGNCGPWD
jgi:hypothetical protein